MSALPAFLINRVQDIRRRAHFLGTLPKMLRGIEVVEAIDGHAPGFDPTSFGPFYRGAFHGEQGFKPGAFACQLSHAKVWRLIVERGLERALVFEDDAHARSSLAHAVTNWPEGADLVFFTHRPDTWTYGMPGGRRSPDLEPIEPPTLRRILRKVFCRTLELWPEAPMEAHDPIDIRDALRHVLARGWQPGQEIRHPGSEGYGLTQAGARALLEQLDALGCCIAADWNLVLAGVCRDDLADVTPQSDPFFHALRDLAPERPRLRAMISGQPSVVHASSHVGGSVLDHSARLGGDAAARD